MRPLFLVLAVALGGCGADRKQASDVAAAAPAAAAPVADAATPVDAAEVVATEPEAVPAALPGWFPVDVYMPADHAVAEVNESRGAHAVELRTHGEVLDIAGQAQAVMLAAGWAEIHYSPVDTRGGASMYYRKGDRSATLAMAGDGEEVRVMYNFATVGASQNRGSEAE